MSMKPALLLVLSSVALSACGGGGSATITSTASSGEITNQPVDGSEATLTAALNQTGQIEATTAFASLSDQAGRVFIKSDFDVELRVDRRQFEGNTLIRTLQTEPLNRLHAIAYNGGDAVVVLNAPNGASVGGSDLPAEVDQSLDYATFGAWFVGNNIDLVSDFQDLEASDFGAFYGVVNTALADMPRNGTATYTGSAIAAELDHDQGTSQLLTGQVTMTANFAAGQLSGSISLNERNGFTVTRVDTADVRISGNTFAGDITSVTGHSGQLEGAFGGPNADEIAGAFALDSAHSTIQGGFGAAR